MVGLVGHATHVAGTVPTHLVTRGARRGLKLVPERHVRSERASVRAQPPRRTVAPARTRVYYCNLTYALVPLVDLLNRNSGRSDSVSRVQRWPARRRLCKAC